VLWCQICVKELYKPLKLHHLSEKLELQHQLSTAVNHLPDPQRQHQHCQGGPQTNWGVPTSNNMHCWIVLSTQIIWHGHAVWISFLLTVPELSCQGT